ncbi:MAG: GspH/FimT family pseudopilin [Moraxellaceae bacterium]
MWQSQKEQGQTLFELTITLLILSILLSMGISSFSHLLKKERGRTAITRMAIATLEARRLGISHRQAITLCPAETGNTCEGSWAGRLVIFAGRADSAAPKIISTFAALEHGRIEWRSFRQDNFLEMQGNGLTLAQNGTFVYCPDDNDVHYAHALIISKSGRARIAEDLDGDGIKELRPGQPITCKA